MASKPTAVEIRAYQVGFGDCFLVTFVYPKDERRHVLVDFGTTALPRRGNKSVKPSEHMPRIAKHIKTVCKDELTAVVATHRHADHISGYATDGRSGGAGKIIAACKPKLVLQPWTEDPKAARDARSASAGSKRSPKKFIASLEAMHRLAQHAWNVALRPPPSMSVAAAKQLRFLGMDNIKNRSAVQNLIAMSRRRGARAVWARHGSASGLERLLPGVKVHVLGPPDLSQTEKIRRMRSSDPDEFWQLLGSARALRGMRVAPVGRRPRSGKPVPAEARWFRDRIAELSAEQLLEIVRVLDDQMNNTSLILLFEVGRKKLLFPGDAQLENWSWALQDAPDHRKTRKLLAEVDFYKVGHHGSRNATPKTLLWENFGKRNRSRGRLKTALSTLRGKHGTPVKKTEVPRRTLLEALQNETDLVNTEGHSLANDEPCQTITIKL